MSSDISEFSIKYNKGHIKIRVINLENGLFILLTDSTLFKLGPTAFAIPPHAGLSSPSSTAILGSSEDLLMVRTLAENVTAWTNRACMVIAAIGSIDRFILTKVLNTLKKFLLN